MVELVLIQGSLINIKTKPMTEATVCFLFRDDEIILAMKKRGFGVGKWNGPGGKIKAGEDMLSATVREVEEEIGVKIDPADLEKVAENEFHFLEKENWDMHVHVFFIKKWQGEPTESEEMKPQWFKIKDIPYDKMWVDDIYWLDKVLDGQKLKAKFYFAGAGDKVSRHEIELVPEFLAI